MANELYVWFSDSYVESISIKSLFFMRLLNYCGLEYRPKWIMLPSDIKNLEIELSSLPVFKHEEKILKSYDILELCKKSALENDKTLVLETRSLATRILFEWATTNLVSLYTYLLCTEEQIKERIFKDYLKIYNEVSEDHLNTVSQTMMRLNAQAEDISYLSHQKKELALEILKGFDDHLIQKEFWLGSEISICDFALFSFCYQLYNPQMVFFRDYIKESEHLFPWMKRMDQLSRNNFSKMKV